MAHITFYRKYRSNTFSELIGQEHIVQTLVNGIENDRLSHAYIFSGPRGTGKTSTARILAKALNCREGKSPAPCLKCDLCEKINKGNSVDVIEIDAASNTGVDNIRDLNEQINYMPVECKFKIYIIDEVHMLSTGAFNALLKTLEEPPKNTIFILATTEPHKIPVTIHSRCQRLNFRRLKNSEILKQLKFIAESEQLVITEPALLLITRNASGCMRDAISLLDQIYSFKGKEIEINDVQVILGATSFETIYAITKELLNSNTEKTLELLKTVIEEGVSIVQLCSDLSEVFRNLIYIRTNLINELDIDETRKNDYQELAGLAEFNELVEIMEALSKTEMDLRWFPNPETLLQIKLLGIMRGREGKDKTHPPSPPLYSKEGGKETRDQQGVLTPCPTSSTPQPVNSGFQPATSPPDQLTKTDEPTNEPADEPTNRTVDQPTKTDEPTNRPTDELTNQPPDEPTPQPITPESWQNVLKILFEKHRMLHSILDGSKIINISNSDIEVQLSKDHQFSFFIEKLAEQKNKDIIQEKINEVYCKNINVKFSISDTSSENNTANLLQETQSPSTIVDQAPSESSDQNQDKPAASKKVNQLIDIFEGNLVS